MQTSLVFDFLSAQNLLVPFLKQDKVLQDLEKEELLSLVEKLLDPPTQETPVEKPFSYVDELQLVVEKTKEMYENQNFTVDTNYRQNTVKMTLQDVLNTLVKDGVIPVGGMSKRDINDTAFKLGLIEYTHSFRNKLWKPSEKGESIGVKTKNNCSVYYSLEAYEMIKSHLLSNG